jgi:hypothetical protein
MNFRPFSLAGGVALFLLAAGPLGAETVKDREGAVRADRDRMAEDPRWIYNDVDEGFARARAAARPLLVVLRCVPCLSCIGMDGAVLAAPDLGPLLDAFVCVRVINANALDLRKFQFDYDLSFSALVFHADGTTLARFGSWTHQKDAADTSLDTFRGFLTRSLALHFGYPANRALVTGKNGPAPLFSAPVEIPELAARYGRELNWEGNVVQSCVHCHQIGDAFRAHFRDRGQPVPEEFLYPMPAPETVGFAVSAGEGPRLGITAVTPDSPAARAGLRPGDAVETFGGQAVVTVADIAWVLHRAPARGTLPATVRRGGTSSPLSLTLTLADGWRRQSDISRRVGTWSMRGMALGGLVLEEADEAARAAIGLAPDALGLRLKGVGKYGMHATARRAGFREGDVLVEIDGIRDRQTEGQLLGRILTDPQGKHPLRATVVRDGNRVNLTLPVPSR